MAGRKPSHAAGLNGPPSAPQHGPMPNGKRPQAEARRRPAGVSTGSATSEAAALEAVAATRRDAAWPPPTPCSQALHCTRPAGPPRRRAPDDRHTAHRGSRETAPSADSAPAPQKQPNRSLSHTGPGTAASRPSGAGRTLPRRNARRHAAADGAPRTAARAATPAPRRHRPLPGPTLPGVPTAVRAAHSRHGSADRKSRRGSQPPPCRSGKSCGGRRRHVPGGPNRSARQRSASRRRPKNQTSTSPHGRRAGTG